METMFVSTNDLCVRQNLSKSSVTHFGITNATTRHMASCGWWRNDGVVVPKCVAPDLFDRTLYQKDVPCH